MSIRGRKYSYDEGRSRKEILRKFRAIARSVMFNRHYLAEMEEQKLSLNVKRNIAMLFRPTRKIGILTSQERATLRTLHDRRSVKDRKLLVSLFMNLSCLSRFSPRVRARLVPVAYYIPLQKNQFLIKEGSTPIMVYFILYGEVEVYKRDYNPITQTYDYSLKGLCGTGDCLGEVELLEGDNRRNMTCLCSMETEVLAVMRDDFDRILRQVMLQQWMDTKIALKAIQYFDFFTEYQYVTACKVGVLRQYDPLETIYYMDQGLASFVHFVISGECMILQCLSIKTTTKNGKKTYSLIDIAQGDTGMFEDLTNKEILKMLLEQKNKYAMYNESDLDSESNEKDKSFGLTLKKHTYADIEKLCANVIKPIEEKKMSAQYQFLDNLTHETLEESELTKSMVSEHREHDHYSESQIETYDSTSENLKTNSRNRIFAGFEKNADVEQQGEDLKQESIETLRSRKIPENVIFNESPGSSFEATSSKTPDSRKSLSETTKSFLQDAHEKTVNHFIDVGAMTVGGIFALGEKSEHRVIITRTSVQCLLLPRYWLLEKEQNPGNIWQRRRFYLDCTIPSRELLFQNFLATLKWQKFKKDMINSTVGTQLRSNPTKVEDIPIICRLTEGEG